LAFCEWAADCVPEMVQIFPLAVRDEVLAKDLIGTAPATSADPFKTPLRISLRLEGDFSEFSTELKFDPLFSAGVIAQSSVLSFM